MALSFSAVKGANYMQANKRVKVVDITLDNSYATGGYTLKPSDFGLRVIEQVIPHGQFRKSDGSASIALVWDRSGSKLQSFVGGTQTANATDLSTYSGRVTVVGY